MSFPGSRYSIAQRSQVGPFQRTGFHDQPAWVVAEMNGAFSSCKLNVYA
jgi:hypothetical protein